MQNSNGIPITVPLTQFSLNPEFQNSKKARQAGTRCILMTLNLEVQLYLSMPSFCRPLHYVNNAISLQAINFEPPCQKPYNPDDHITYLYLLHLQINELGHIFSTSADFSRLAKNSVKVDNVKHMVNDIIDRSKMKQKMYTLPAQLLFSSYRAKFLILC